MTGNELYFSYLTVAYGTAIFTSSFNRGTDMNYLEFSTVTTSEPRMREWTRTTNKQSLSFL